MTSWVWMKGVETAVADPIDPVSPEDDRPAVKDLIRLHEDKIGKIREALSDHPLYDASKHDDLWILRFWLSHKKYRTAIKAAKHTLEFRKEHGLDEKDIRLVPPHNVTEGKLKEYLDCWKDDALVFTHPDPRRGVIAFFNFASMDQHVVVEKLTEDHWLPTFLYCSEWAFQWLDFVTRTTGRLTRSVRFIDLRGLSMAGFNKECSRRDGKAMALMEDCYPQLLETLFACNPPLIVDVLWNIVRVILPKRVVTKFDFIKPKENASHRNRVLRHISLHDLPDFHGGENTVPPHDWKTEMTMSNGKVSE